MMDQTFAERLKQVFDNATMAVIARRLGIPHATVRNYFRGRLPAPDVLIKIANETNVSLNWLLTGHGEMFAGTKGPRDAARALEQAIESIVERKLAGLGQNDIQDLGSVDRRPEFDVAAALRRTSDPHRAMSEWFEHEGRTYPHDFGVIFFQGWEAFSEDERLDALRDAKKVLDRTLKKR